MAKTATTKSTKTTKLPKRVAGVKLPKALRQSGGKVADWMRHPLVADLAAMGLLAVAAALKDNKRVRNAAGTAKKKAGKAASDVSQSAATLGTVIAAKASKGAKRLGETYEGLGAGGRSGNGDAGPANTKPRATRKKRARK